MSDAAELSTLTLDQVTQLIAQAKTAGANPMLVGIGIFNSLGDNATLTGPTLALALTNSAIPVSPPVLPLLNAIQNVSKAGNHISVTLNQDTDVLMNKTRVTFGSAISFDVNDADGDPALINIVGVTGHKGMFSASVKNIQLNQNQGHWSAAIKTSLTTINIDLN